MGNKKNHARKNKRLANNWRNILKMRKGKKTNVTSGANSHKLNISDNQRLNYTKDENNSCVDDNGSLTRTACRENITQSKRSESQDDCLVMNFTETQRIVDNTQTYYSLQKLDPNEHTRIVRGDFHQSHERFSELSRGKQCVPIALVALCFCKINNPATWRTCDINNIVIIGDRQYYASYKKMYREDKCPQAQNLVISEVYPYIKIDRKYFYLNAMDCSYFENDVLNLNKLIMSLERFFHENEDEYVVFTCNNFSFAVMQKSNSFFVFNPYSTSYAGEPMHPQDRDGTACLMEVFTIQCLANHLLILCNQGHRVFDDSECDPPVIYSLTTPMIENIVFGANVSKRNKVNRDLCIKAPEFERQESTLYGNKADHVCLRNTVSELPKKVNSILKQASVDSTNAKLVNGPKNSSSLFSCSFDFNEWMRTNDNNVDGGNVLIGCGMVNIGNSCFFNACLQALFHIPILNIHFQKMERRICTCVVCNIITAFKDTHTQNQTSYNPSNLYKAMQEKNKNLLNGEQEDAQEFWIRIMEAIENEKNSVMYNKLFSHEVLTFVKCVFCHTISKTKRICIGHVIEIHGQLTIQQAVDTYFAEDVLETYKCSACKVINKDMAKKSYLLKSIPNILCLVLSRFENKEKKIHNGITLNEQLRLSDFIFSRETAHITYKLVSIVNHVGANLNNGHYTTTVCSSNNAFYEFDDKFVNSTDTISGSNAYILIYELSQELSSKIPLSYFRTIGVNDDNCDEMRNRQIKSEMQDDVSSMNFNFDDGIDKSSEINDIHMVENEEYDDAMIQGQSDIGQSISIENESASAQERFRCATESPDDTDVRYNEELNEYDFEDANIQCSDNITFSQALSGRRIVDIGYLVFQMEHLSRHSEGCDSRMVLQNETKMGLRSIFHYQCPTCGDKQKIQTSSKNADIMNVNKAAALGITSIGSGFYHMEELFAHLDIPCMSSSTFDTENKQLQKDWIELAKYHSEEALKEEIALAIAKGDVDSSGNALIVVVCDGSWGKRSYGKGYSSLSGCAAIIGYHTKKILYFDSKNKYCDTCTKSYAKNCPPNYHTCNISYTGPSSGMETEILVEGFKSCELLGARFHKIISDGDSSAFKEISERCIYQNPDVVIQKLECVNHLFKNFHKKISSLRNDTKYGLKCRKLLNPSMGEELSQGIRSAAKHWRETDVSFTEKLQNLEKDCLNAPYHYLGNHNNCNDYFCQKATTAASIAKIDSLKSGGLFHEIINYCNIYFASNVRSLIEDCTTNSAEELNNIIAKYLGGKRINYSLAGSYSGRVAAAVVQYNTKGHAGSEFQKVNNISPNNSCLKIENSRIRHYAKNEAARQLKPRTRTTKDKITKDYEGQKQDMSEHALEIAKNVVLEKVATNRQNRDKILADTIGQKYNFNWLEGRKQIINSSYFGRIINSQSPKSYTKLLEEMLYSPSELGNSAEVRHQRLYEKEALEMFSLVHKKHVLEQTGIFIDPELSFLGTSPLRLYGSESIVNVQCPVKAFGKTIDEAMTYKSKKKLLPFFKKNNGKISINKKSNCYIELQGQLHITGRNVAYLVVWLGPEFKITNVKVDHDFWNNQMKKKLQFFFNEAMIKELANSRRARRMKLREYDPQTKTFV